jgi:hypothetical protein
MGVIADMKEAEDGTFYVVDTYGEKIVVETDVPIFFLLFGGTELEVGFYMQFYTRVLIV